MRYMKKILNWFLIKPRIIDEKVIDNQWIWLGGWLVYEPDKDGDDPPCPTFEVIYRKWRLMLIWYKKKLSWIIIFKFYPYRISNIK